MNLKAPKGRETWIQIITFIVASSAVMDVNKKVSCEGFLGGGDFNILKHL